MVPLKVECEKGKMKRVGNKDQVGEQGEGEAIQAKARKEICKSPLGHSKQPTLKQLVSVLSLSVTSHNNQQFLSYTSHGLSAQQSQVLIQCRYRTFSSLKKVISDNAGLGEVGYKMKKVCKTRESLNARRFYFI